MGLFTYHTLNEGVHIEGDGVSIDIIVRAIMGTQKRREADLEIRGISHLEKLHLKYSDGLAELMQGIEMGIRDTKRSRGRRIEVHYRVDKNYTIEKRVYK